MVGFPPIFSRNHQLKTFIKRFLWYNVLHATVNYALAPDFLPISAPKLYKAESGDAFDVFESNLRGVDAAVSFSSLILKTLGIANVLKNVVTKVFTKINSNKLVEGPIHCL